MFTRHKLKEPVKRYLLGTLDEPAASSLEASYFSDPVFFEWMWRLENDLITSYLLGQLTAAERQSFEGKYLEIPALKKRLEEVRSALEHRRSRNTLFRFRFVAVGALSVCVAASVWLLLRHPGPSVPSIRVEQVVAKLDVRLVPSLTQGETSRQIEISPPAGGRLRISFDLPGLTSSAECRAALALVGSAGRTTVYTSPLVKPEMQTGGAQLPVEIESARLHSGDYIAQVSDANGGVLQSYSFRIVPAK